MKRIVVFSLIVLAVACNKDKFQTKPQIKIKSFSSDVVALNQDLRVILEYTDKEGDVTDSVFMVRQRLNWRGPKRDTLEYKIPKFPDTMEGEIQLDLRYSFALTTGLPAITIPGSGGKKQADTLNLKFVVRDQAGNKSDTASKGVIVMRE